MESEPLAEVLRSSSRSVRVLRLPRTRCPLRCPRRLSLTARQHESRLSGGFVRLRGKDSNLDYLIQSPDIGWAATLGDKRASAPFGADSSRFGFQGFHGVFGEFGH
jgi:hypothetical protein